MSDAKPATDAEVAEWKRGIHHVVADFDSMKLSLKVAARIAADAAEIKRLREALEPLVPHPSLGNVELFTYGAFAVEKVASVKQVEAARAALRGRDE